MSHSGSSAFNRPCGYIWRPHPINEPVRIPITTQSRMGEAGFYPVNVEELDTHEEGTRDLEVPKNSDEANISLE